MFDLNLSQLALPLPENTDVVDFVLKINGVEAPQEIEIVSIHINRCFNRISWACISILDGSVAEQAFPIGDQDTLSPGNEIEILAGYLPNRDTIFKGIIIRHSIKIEADRRPHLEIECKDQAVKMTIGRKNKYFFDDTDSGIIESIAREHDLDLDVESSSVSHPEMVQYFSTDWDFVLTRAEANGKLVLTKDGELVVKAPDFGQSPEFTVTYGSTLYEFEAEMDARDQYPSAKATAWDPGAQEIIESETSPSGGGLGGFGSGLGDAVSAVGGALGVNLPGAPPNLDYSQVIGIPNYLVQHSGRLSQEELQSWAEAQFLKSDLAKAKGRVKILGIANLYPGMTLSLQGVGARHSGDVYITAVRHEIKEGSWFTHAQFGLPHDWFAQMFNDVQDKPAAKLLPGVCGLQIGIVTKLENDPEGEHRIQVRLPIVDSSSDGIWVRIALQDAGDNRSAFFLPEIGDEVIVGFVNDDPRDPIVLGMLNSSAKPTPFTAADDNHEKGWQTRSGMKMVFNDEKSSYLLETPAGKKMSVDDDDDAMVMEDQHGNKIIMDSNGITIEASQNLVLKAQSDVQVEGLNINQKASVGLKCEGSSTAEISASGQVVVKGGIVQIN